MPPQDTRITCAIMAPGGETRLEMGIRGAARDAVMGTARGRRPSGCAALARASQNARVPGCLRLLFRDSGDTKRGATRRQCHSGGQCGVRSRLKTAPRPSVPRHARRLWRRPAMAWGHTKRAAPSQGGMMAQPVLPSQNAILKYRLGRRGAGMRGGTHDAVALSSHGPGASQDACAVPTDFIWVNSTQKVI